MTNGRYPAYNVDLCAGTDSWAVTSSYCPADLNTRLRLSLPPSPPLMTSTDWSSQEHVLRLTVTLKLPLVCIKTLTRNQIRTKMKSAK